MKLLQGILSSLLDDKTDVSVVLLRLRALAAQLGSRPLDDWIKYESQGYPIEADLPPYRIVPVSYKATFSGPMGSVLTNAPIPLGLIDKFAGESWTRKEIRDSIASVNELARPNKDGDTTLQFDAADLILLLQGKVYELYSCNSVTGYLSRTSLVEIQHAVRNRILDFAFALQDSVPGAADITVGKLDSTSISESEKVTQIYHQTIYGTVTNVGGDAEVTNVGVVPTERDTGAFVEALVSKGIGESDATELASIVASEPPGTRDDLFGKKAKAWIAKNIGKALDGAWNAGLQTATRAITEAVMAYHGLR